jgi:pyridoxine 5-phosphate synthase
MAATVSARAPRHLRLYINVDHVATIRQARRGQEPDPAAAAEICERAGADGITAHLREDRRHIQDHDVTRIQEKTRGVFNLEMACIPEMLALAERIKPQQVTLVPEKRAEITTEGGLDLARDASALRDGIRRLNAAGIRTSLFIDPDEKSVRGSRELGAAAIELHTGQYAHQPTESRNLDNLRAAAQLGAGIGLAVHAGHGLTVTNVSAVAAIHEVEELNIGHSVVSRAIFIGIGEAVKELRAAMDAARSQT